MTPAGIQPEEELLQRRLIVAVLNLATIGALAWAFALVFGSNGWSWLDLAIYTTILIGLPWTVMGFWNALIGLWLLHGRRDGHKAVSPYLDAAVSAEPLRLRTALFMTLRNEDPVRAFTRLRIMHQSLLKTGEAHAFDYFILSDTSKPEIALEEERLFEEWKRELGGEAAVFYRRRIANEGFKAGNIRDFLARWGEGYDLMLPLDADSLMTGEAIVRLARIMQAYPRLGILQSLVVGAPSTSAFARIFQFGMRHGMRSYTMGSAWWAGDCGPYWGHNAMVRVKPFKEACDLPVLPGKPPLGGHVLSHDQIEAALMRRAGYEVRVLPVEGGSYEDNPPTLLDFTKRDLRWCQGNMQYFRLIGLPGLLPMSRFQIGAAIWMYVGAAAWMAMIALMALKAFETGLGNLHLELGMALFFTMFGMSMTPKLAGLIDIALTKGGMERYGGPFRFLASALIEIVFSILLSPIACLRVTLFMIALLFGRAVMWSGQNRDAYGLSWATAISGLWPQTLAGAALFAIIYTKAPGALIWASPMLAALLLAAPFAVLTASPRFGEAMARLGLCAIPEEFDTPEELKALGGPDHSLRGAAGSHVEGQVGLASHA
jgi:membrane glycosyltransferase